MSMRNVTVTSKNQITLPSEYVKRLNLATSRVLYAELREGSIVLTPPPQLGDAMKIFWGKHKAGRALSDTEIKQAVRNVSSRRASR